MLHAWGRIDIERRSLKKSKDLQKSKFDTQRTPSPFLKEFLKTYDGDARLTRWWPIFEVSMSYAEYLKE
jgi:hypothetical protein